MEDAMRASSKTETPLVTSTPGGPTNILGVHNGPIPVPPPSSATTAQSPWPSPFERRKSAAARWSEHKPAPTMGRSASTPDVPSLAPGLDRRSGSYRRDVPDIGWGPLFEPGGGPTERLARFLKGLARYIVSWALGVTTGVVLLSDKPD
jgi:hypothetical protein